LVRARGKEFAVMTWLLLATGFFGGLTFIFLARRVHQLLGSPPAVQTHFTPGKCIEPIVQAIGKARREVLLLARSIASPSLAQALADAKLRDVKIEIVLDPSGASDPTGDYAFLVDQSLAPVVRSKDQPPLHEYLLIVDGSFVATGSFPLSQQAEENSLTQLVVVSGHPEFARACKAHFLEQRGSTKSSEPEEKPKEDSSPTAQLSKEPEKPAKSRLGKAREALDAATSAAAVTDGKLRLKNVPREEAAASS